MRYIFLLSLALMVFLGYGLAQSNIYTATVTGFPSAAGLPDLYLDSSSGRIAATRQVQEVLGSTGELTFQFYIPSGTYRVLEWNGHGTRVSSSLHLCSERRENISDLAILLDEGPVNPKPLYLPAPNMLDVLMWLAFHIWPLLVVFGFFDLYRSTIERLRESPATGERVRFFSRCFLDRPYLSFVLALAPLGLACALPGTIRYDVGDDPAMEMLSSGYVSGQPSEYLIFINVLVGLPLKGLYLIMGKAPWYPLLLLLAMVAPLIGIALRLMREEGGPSALIKVIVLNTAFGTYFVSHFQFTSAAYLTGLYGLILLIVGRGWTSFISALAAVFCCSLIRFESFYLLMATAGLPAFWLSQRPWMTRGIFFATAFILALGGRVFDAHYYESDKDWAAYRNYNSFRGSLQETPEFAYNAVNRSVYDAAGWTKNDYEMFAEHWLYEDPVTFGADKLAYLKGHLKSDRNVLTSLVVASLPVIYAPAAALLFLVLVLRSFSRFAMSKMTLAVILLPMLGILFYLAMAARLPGRVAVPCLYAGSVFMLLTARPDNRAGLVLPSRTSFHLAMLTVATIAFGMLIQRAQENRQNSATLLQSLDRLGKNGDEVLVGSINAVRLERLFPFTALSKTGPLDIIHLMWSGGSPSFQAQLLRHRSSSLFESLAQDPKFFLMVPTSRWDRADSFSRYMNLHHGANIHMTPLILKDGTPAIFPDFTVMGARPAGNP
jgi:hypothetical protein